MCLCRSRQTTRSSVKLVTRCWQISNNVETSIAPKSIVVVSKLLSPCTITIPLFAAVPLFFVVHRYQIVKELLDTERTYCAALSSIQDEFVRPLCESELISAKDLK